MSTCERCGAEIEKSANGDDWWCTDNCQGIIDRIRARRDAFCLNATAHPCNLCGLSCLLDPQHPPAGLIDATVVGGYPSTPGNGNGALDDNDGYRFSLCEFCLDWLFAQFRIPVAMVNTKIAWSPGPGESIGDAMQRTGGFVSLVTGPDPDPWRPAEQRVREDAWREDKEGFSQEKARRDIARRQR